MRETNIETAGVKERGNMFQTSVLHRYCGYGKFVSHYTRKKGKSMCRDESIMVFSPPIMLLSNSQEMYQLC